MALDPAARRALFAAVGERDDVEPREPQYLGHVPSPSDRVQAQQNGVGEGAAGARAVGAPAEGLVSIEQSPFFPASHRGKSEHPEPGHPPSDIGTATKAATAFVRCADLAPGTGPLAKGPGADLGPGVLVSGYQLRGRWLTSERYQPLRNAAWMVRNSRVGGVNNPVALQVVLSEVVKLSEEGEKLFDIIEALAELLVHP